MADIAMRPSLEPDPIAELARLIGQADPQGRSAPAEKRFHEQTAPDGHEGPPVLPLAPHTLRQSLQPKSQTQDNVQLTT